MGITRANPLSTSAPTFSTSAQQPVIPSTPSNSTFSKLLSDNAACLSYWKDFPQKTTVLLHLQQCSKFAELEEDKNLVRLCHFCHQRTESQKPAFYCLEQCVSLLELYCEEESKHALLYDLLYLVAFNLPLIVRSLSEMDVAKEKGEESLSTFTTSLLSHLLVLTPSSPLYSVLCLSLSILASTQYQHLLDNDLFITTIQTLCDSVSREDSHYRIIIPFLANLTTILPQHNMNEDPDDFVLLLVEMLADRIVEEENELLFKMKIAGIANIVKKGGIVERLRLQEKGVCKSNSDAIRLPTCKHLWNELVLLCNN